MNSFRPPLKHITDAQRLQINMLGRQVTSFIVLELSEMKVSFFFREQGNLVWALCQDLGYVSLLWLALQSRIEFAKGLEYAPNTPYV
jgi:hypothetical protein